MRRTVLKVGDESGTRVIPRIYLGDQRAMRHAGFKVLHRRYLPRLGLHCLRHPFLADGQDAARTVQ